MVALKAFKPITVVLTLLLVLTGAAFISQKSWAQVVTTKTVSLKLAERLITACEIAARSKKLSMSLSVVDYTGNPVMIKRMDGASYKTLEVATGKAKTAALLGVPSAALQELVDNGKLSYLTIPDMIMIRGGLPIMDGDDVIGGFAASGSTEVQDEDCVQSALQKWDLEKSND
ncbi:GlcG/HbpS family heme-binding protein [Kordiimonas pumila]|uniref:Heme-binding protein n=1 Tax=Kordiimonas pumila TaxID=2161677 RepID=A0ABV7D2T0_9PROT|nr:heme-binding protein [Kordiimonas pumila]